MGMFRPISVEEARKSGKTLKRSGTSKGLVMEREPSVPIYACLIAALTFIMRSGAIVVMLSARKKQLA
jgi:hypothetical protein